MFARSWAAIIVSLVLVALGMRPALAVDPDFGIRHNFGTGVEITQSVAVGDIDGDGDLDIVTGNVYQQNLVYLNDGAGDFAGTRNFGTGSDNTYSVAMGDMDGDGDLDIVTGNNGQQRVVYFNDGAGNFTVALNFGTG